MRNKMTIKFDSAVTVVGAILFFCNLYAAESRVSIRHSGDHQHQYLPIVYWHGMGNNRWDKISYML